MKEIAHHGMADSDLQVQRLLGLWGSQMPVGIALLIMNAPTSNIYRITNYL